jgi:hypothetical protein
MAEIPTKFLVHTVDVDPYAGSGAYGDEYSPTVTGVQCFRDDKRKLVRSADGEQVVSETTLYMRLAHAASFPPGSRVQLPHRVATVITCAERTDGGLGAWQHLEVTLT